ncbi:mucin-2 [Cucurbita maxima]|uniref:Mucin-2 n=1 Tax=Cucurbita maxima TaxID=3661 RepID=A0A6J1HUD2_CUCMA|nr:mucin-2 [Cucurbita maxima]
MAQTASKCFFFSILSLLAICSSGRFGGSHLDVQENASAELEWKFSELVRTTMHDATNSPTTNFPTTPDTSTPTIITVPATNPVTVTPSSPASTPVSIPLTTPITVPANSPVPLTNPVAPPVTVPGAQPITNPVTTYPAPSGGSPVVTPVTNPVPVSPPAMTNAPVIPGQSWCVVRSGASEMALQSALDYACGTGADCSQIQQGGSCYNPNTLENHASFAFNSYFQKNPSPTSCDFGGSAMVTNSNPSTGSCLYPSSSSSATPASMTPSVPTPTPTTTAPITVAPTIVTNPTSSPVGTGMPENGTPPAIFNPDNPSSSIGSSTGFGTEIPPSSSTSISMAAGLRPFTWCIIMTMSLITRRIILEL